MKLISIDKDVNQYRQYLLVYERKSGEQTFVHFTTPLDIPDPIDNDFAFIYGAIAAFILGEDYEQTIPASKEIQENFDAVKKIWLGWHSYRKNISINVPTLIRKSQQDSRQDLLRGSFFSGGIDSLFTTATLKEDVTALISIAHTPNDIGIIASEFDRLREMSGYANATDRKHLFVASDFMTAFPEVNDFWAYLAHGAALSAIAHRLNAVLNSAVISSTFTYDQLIPWGSHPETDELLSSKSIHISHFGANSNRVQKTFAICEDETALGVVSVCGAGRLDGEHVNCSKCQKCLRTMVTIDLAGVDKSRASTFDWTIYNPANLKDILLRSESEFIFMQEIQDIANDRGREDISKPIDQMIAKSRKFLILTKIEMYLRQRVKFITRFKRPLLKFRAAIYRLLGLKRKLDA
ncbi:MAG: hypothetical protein EX271_04075 [Acidimicrobiales bacterium]|nr:hypothetical protein [Hyphomonadaceae bacterium]RZV43306.1 MAG: hypothetical protein EX271_04075 [Acidimicrobiales bacterium]